MKNLLLKLFKLITPLLSAILKPLGKLHSPDSIKQISFTNVDCAKHLLQVGDIIVTRTLGEMSTIMIPGHWKHAAIYVGGDYIVDATGPGVQQRYLEDLLMKTDSFAIMRLITNDEVVKGKIAQYAKSKIGLPYNYSFNINDTTHFYCSELVFYAVNDAIGEDFIDLRECLGVKTFTPQDCYDATKKFKKIMEI